MGFEPIGLETFVRRLVDNELRKGFKRHPELLPDGGAWVLGVFGGGRPGEATPMIPSGQVAPNEVDQVRRTRGGDLDDRRLGRRET